MLLDYGAERFFSAGDGGGGNTPPANSGGGNQPPAQQPQSPAQQPPAQQTQATWETWLASQAEDVRTTVTPLYEAHTQGLRSALESERGQRRDLEKQLREATAKLENGSEARTKLEQVTAQFAEAQKRSDFFDEAVRPEIGCAQPRLAYLAAQEIDAYDKRGNVDWELLKKKFPELFRQPRPTAPPANAGSGGTPPPAFDMNAALRQAAGRGKM